MNDRDLLEQGLEVRREVLRAEHVDRSLAQGSEVQRPMQELTTEYCWGAVWSRPGLDRGTRAEPGDADRAQPPPRARAARPRCAHQWVTPAEIQETLPQAAVYSGIPAATDAFRTAEAVLSEQGVDVGAPDRER